MIKKLIKAFIDTCKDPHLFSSKPHYHENTKIIKHTIKRFTIDDEYLREYNGETIHCKTSIEDIHKVKQEINKRHFFLAKDLGVTGVQQSRIYSVIRYLQSIDHLTTKRNKDRTLTSTLDKGFSVVH